MSLIVWSEVIIFIMSIVKLFTAQTWVDIISGICLIVIFFVCVYYTDRYLKGQKERENE